jgi:hypothetical protein
MRLRIAAAAARLMAEDGIDDYALAKRKAAKQLGADDTRSLPGNEEVEAELRAYQSLYQDREQRERIRELRTKALEAMRLLAEFRPYLAGAVLKGTAGRYGEIDLQLFTDDSKAVEIALLNRNIPYDVSDERRFASGRERAVSVLRLLWNGIPLNVSIYASNDERATLKNSAGGRAIDRADLDSVAELLGEPR